MDMEGYTIAEMAEMLGIPYETAKVRLFRAGIKPKTKEAIYEKSALDVIRTPPSVGRPRKPKDRETGE